MTKVLTSLFCFSVFFAFAQQEQELVEGYIEQVRNKTNVAVPAQLLKANCHKIYNTVVPYCEDSNELVRQKSLELLLELGLRSDEAGFRSMCLEQLVNGLKDIDDDVSAFCLQSLKLFHRNEFVEKHQHAVLEEFRTGQNKGACALLLGFLKTDGAKPLLESELSRATGRDREEIQLSLARMGDEQAANAVLMQAMALEVNDEFIHEVAPKMLYTRSERVVSFLIQIIKSENKGCKSANQSPGQNGVCAYPLLEHVAPVVQGFPLQVNGAGVLEVEDQEQAIKTARNWFQNNQKFELRSDIY